MRATIRAPPPARPGVTNVILIALPPQNVSRERADPVADVNRCEHLPEPAKIKTAFYTDCLSIINQADTKYILFGIQVSD
jgi:hypothetical protein